MLMLNVGKALALAMGMNNIDALNDLLNRATWISRNTLAAKLLRKELTRTQELPIVGIPSELCFQGKD